MGTVQNPNHRQAPKVAGERNLLICSRCVHHLRERCVEECAPELKYRYLTPKPLGQWGQPPKMVAFEVLVEASAAERLALIYLWLWYADCRNTNE